MAQSQNGYEANNRSLVSSRPVPGTTRKLTVRNGPTGDLLLWVAGQFDDLVEKIDQGQLDDWGYAERDIRGSTEVSNHASGTAIDLNATAHVLGTQPSASYSHQEIDRIHAILARTEGCVRWGGDYTGRKDGMHFEIVKSEAACEAVLAKLTKPAGPAAPTEENELDATEKRMLRELHAMLRPGQVKVQTPGVLTRELAEILVNGRKANGVLAGLQAAQEQLAKTGKVDMAAVTKAAADGAKQGADEALDEALKEIEAAAQKAASEEASA